MNKYFFILFFLISSVANAGTEHLAQEGDTYKSIAIEYYKSEQCLDILKYVNTQAKGHSLVIPGEYIFIPDESLCSYIQNTKYDKDIKKERGSRFFTKVGFSPIKYSNVNSEKDIAINADTIYTYKKYEIFGSYSFDSYSSTDSLRDVTVKSSNQNADITYDRKAFFSKGLDMVNFISYKREKEGDIYITEHAIRVGPLGIKKTWSELDSWLDDFSLTLVPIYEYLEENIENYNPSTFEETYNKTYSKFFRLSFGMTFSFGIETLAMNITNEMYYRPAYNLKNSEVEMDNADYENTLTVEYTFNDIASISYENKITWDRRNKFVKQLPSTEIINTLYLNFSFIH